MTALEHHRSVPGCLLRALRRRPLSGFRKALSTAVVIALLAVVAAACDDGPPQSEPVATAMPTSTTDPTAPTVARAVEATPTAASTPPPTQQSGQPTRSVEPTPAATAPPPPDATPTPTPGPKPPGYLHGAEHGIALLQTTRKPSETREGWMDITLILATLKFAGDVDDREHQKVDANSLCYLNEEPPHDCLFVAWGSEEQFEAEITASHPSDEFGFYYKTDLLFVAFEVAANATQASLFFGEQHKIPINLQGDDVQIVHGNESATAPTPLAPSGRSAGYFMDVGHGIAITGVRRGPPEVAIVRERYPQLSLIEVDISILSLHSNDALSPEIEIEAEDGDICFGSSSGECLRVRWGAERQFAAALPIKEGDVEWPRGKGLPRTIGFVVPSLVEQATIEFGEHRIPIDLRGMTGEEPAWDYTLHYPELPVGSTLYDSNNKTVVLDEVRQESNTGDITLVFHAANESEATDFAPVIELAGSRVSESGKVFDGDLDPTKGWRPHTVQIEGDKLVPGQSALIEHTIARVYDRNSQLILYYPNPEDRPDGTILQLTVSDSLTDAGTRISEAGYVRYVRISGEAAYWSERLLNVTPGDVLWRYQTGGSVFSSPTVSGGVVYVGSRDDHLYALDVAAGDLLWRYQTGWPVLSSPTVSSGVVYVGSRDDHLYALDVATGDLLWRYQTGDRVESSPTVSSGVVYVGSNDDHLYALDAITGDLLWRYQPGDRVESSPTVSSGVVYVGSNDDHLYALDAITGDLLWRYQTGVRVESSPTVSGGVVYVGSVDDHLYALDTATGEFLWSYETGSDVDSSPIVSGGVVYVGSDDDHLYALDAATGEFLWSYETGSDVDSSPIVSGGVVYVGSDDDHLYALDAATGEFLWSYETGNDVNSSPIVSGVVYVGSDDGYLYAIVASPPR